MAINEQSRYALHQRLDEVLGADHAGTLMEHLPVVGWADLATKQDIAALEERVGARFDQMDLRFDRMDARLERFETGMTAEMDARLERFEVGMTAQLDARLERFETGMTAQLDAFRTEMRSELRFELARHLQVVVFAVISSLIALGGVLVAAIKL